MKVKELMQPRVVACKPDDFLNDAARLMWENDCGVIPVEEGDKQLRGILTDRDICMAAYTKGRPLAEISVGEVMNPATAACKPDDDIAVVHKSMRERQVRRMPVTDGKGRLAGILSLNDLAVSASRSKGDALREVAITLADVSRHRQAVPPSR